MYIAVTDRDAELKGEIIALLEKNDYQADAGELDNAARFLAENEARPDFTGIDMNLNVLSSPRIINLGLNTNGILDIFPSSKKCFSANEGEGKEAFDQIDRFQDLEKLANCLKMLTFFIEGMDKGISITMHISYNSLSADVIFNKSFYNYALMLYELRQKLEFGKIALKRAALEISEGAEQAGGREGP
ncbi:hypothetical protein FACS1894216_16400 [Synergistales bacterium]|nr:hypothetical protein FACS1894216_16400 [Synergistales bacterium]